MRGLLRLGLGALRRGPFKRHLLRIRFGPWAPRWIGGRVEVGWRGVRVEIDPGEAHGFHVFVHGDYGGAELDACIELAAGARVFIDVGAHIGLVALAVARACPGVRVVAVEADPDVARWLRRNLALNPALAARITVLEAAASDHDGDVMFETSASADNVGVGHVTDRPSPHGRRIRAVALGRWLLAHELPAEIVKMDIEGGELAALAGLWAAGLRPRAILLETHGHMFEPAHDFNARVLDALGSESYGVERLERGTWTRVTDAGQLGGRSHLKARLADPSL